MILTIFNQQYRYVALEYVEVEIEEDLDSFEEVE